MESSTKLLSEWLHQLRCPMELTQRQLQKLNSLKMKSIWRHLKSRIKPTFSAQTVKKNLLLKKLDPANASMQSADYENFKIESIKDLTIVEEINNVQELFESLENKTEVLDHQLNSSASALIVKNVEKKVLKDRVKEVKDKSGLFESMADSIKGTIANIEEEMTFLSVCEFSPAPVSYLEMKQSQATLVNYVQQLSNLETEDENFISEIIMNTVHFSPITNLNSVMFLSNLSLESLNTKLFHKMWTNEQSSTTWINVSLRNLTAEILRNQTEICHSLKEIDKLSMGFENSIKALSETVKEQVLRDEEKIDSSRTIGMLSSFLQEVRLHKKDCKVMLLVEELFTSSIQVGCLKSTVNSNQEERERMQNFVAERVNDINELLQNLFDRKESLKLSMSTIQKKNSELASTFIMEYNLSKIDDTQCHFASFRDWIQKEVDLFQRVPLVALTRKWEDLSSVLSDKVDGEFSKHRALCSVLLHSELKNVSMSLLEKLYWLHGCE